MAQAFRQLPYCAPRLEKPTLENDHPNRPPLVGCGYRTNSSRTPRFSSSRRQGGRQPLGVGEEDDGWPRVVRRNPNRQEPEKRQIYRQTRTKNLNWNQRSDFVR